MPTKNINKKIYTETEKVVKEEPEVKEAVEPVVEEKAKSSNKATVVDCYSVNVRKTAEVSNNVITIINAGDVVNVISNSGEWTKVKVPNGPTGFIMSEFLKEI